VQTPSGPQREAVICWRASDTAPAARHNAPMRSSGVR
jgi:hypothetical protein